MNHSTTHADDPFNYSGKLAFLRRVCADSRLPKSADAVAAVLVDYAHRSNGKTHVSVLTIVRESGVPRSTALRALERLEELGWMTTEKRFGCSTVYTLTGTTVGTGSGDDTGTTQNLRKGRTGSGGGTGPVPVVGPKQKDLKATGVRASAGAADAIPFQQIVEVFNELLTGLPKVIVLNDKRRVAMRRAWNASPSRQTLEFWRRYFAECQDDPFHNGTGPYGGAHANWRPTFDFLIRDDVVTRIYERAMHELENAA